MTPDETRMLLGGYATGSLTEEERQALFSAALEDQKIFDALADEEALRELLADPRYRRELAAELSDQEASFGEKLAAWWRRPLPLALAGGVAAVALAVVVLYQRETPPETFEVAMRQIVSEPESILEKKDVPPAGKAEEAEGGRRTETSTEAPQPVPVAPGEREPSQARSKVATPADVSAPSPAKENAGKTAAFARGDLAAEAEEPARQASGKDAEEDRAQPERGRIAMAEATMADEVSAVGAAAPQPQSETQPSPPVASLRAARDASSDSRPAARQLSAGLSAALSYVVDRRTDDGSFVAVGDESTMSRRDIVRLRVRVPAAGQLYVAERTTDDQWRLIHSSPVSEPGWSKIPSQGGIPPPASAGERRLTILFSRVPLSLPSAGVFGQLDSDAAELTTEVTFHYE